ncbi:MAG: hypothetical protein ABI359_09785 [Ginsengibacter sp.]
MVSLKNIGTFRLLKYLLILAFSVTILYSCHQKPSGEYSKWEVYGGNKEANHYSSLSQIDTNNVTQLQVAWTYHTGDADSMTQIQVNSIIIDSTLFGVSPKLKLFALNASTGKPKWVYDPMSDPDTKKQEILE